MATLDELTLYFYIASGITTACLLLLFIMVGLLFSKVNRQSRDESNQLSRQTNMMADFCYTNPTIVPGEELSRRGFSMYSGSNHITGDDFRIKGKDYYNIEENRSKNSND